MLRTYCSVLLFLCAVGVFSQTHIFYIDLSSRDSRLRHTSDHILALLNNRKRSASFEQAAKRRSLEGARVERSASGEGGGAFPWRPSHMLRHGPGRLHSVAVVGSAPGRLDAQRLVRRVAEDLTVLCMAGVAVRETVGVGRALDAEEVDGELHLPT